MRKRMSVAVAIGTAVMAAVWLTVEGRAQAPEPATLGGIWILNHDLSDQPARPGDRGDGQPGRRGGGYGRRGGMGRGGFGGGSGRGGRMGGDPEAMARMREAMRDIMNPPDRLTITETASLIAITAPDGRTTRLSPDNKSIKDDNTKVERKTRWDAGKLVSEISGLGRGKMTQTFAVDPDHQQLRITVEMQGGRQNQPRTVTTVYDADHS